MGSETEQCVRLDMIYDVIASGLFESTHPHDVNEIPYNFSVTAILISILKYIHKLAIQE